MQRLPRNKFLPLLLPNTDGGENGGGGGGGNQQQQPNQQPNQQAQPAPTRPDYLPESFWDPTKNAVKGDDLKAHFESFSKRQAEIVTDPAKVELKSALKDRAGNPIDINREEPLVKAVLALAKDRGLTTGDVQAMTDMVVQAELAAAEAEQQEFLAFGGGDEAKANARLTALIARGATLLGKDDQGKPTADAMKAMNTIAAGLSTKAQFEALEKLIGVDPAAASGTGSGKPADIAKSWYGEDGLSGTGMKKAS